MQKPVMPTEEDWKKYRAEKGQEGTYILWVLPDGTEVNGQEIPPELRNTSRVKSIQMDWPEGMRPHIGPHVGPPRPPSYQECVNLPQANVAQPRRAAMTQVDQPMSPAWMYSPEVDLPPSPDMLAQSPDLAAQRSPMETDQPSQALMVHPEANRENPDENPLR